MKVQFWPIVWMPCQKQTNHNDVIHKSGWLPKMSDEYRSTFLFATPTWSEGAGRLMDFGNTMTEYNRTSGDEDPDIRATTQDWLAVGDCIRWAMKQLSSNVLS